MPRAALRASAIEMRRLPIAALTTLSTSVLMLLALAPAALAENDGRGFYGATDDEAVTYAGFIVIAFFPPVRVHDEHDPAPSGEAQGSGQGRAGSTSARPTTAAAGSRRAGGRAPNPDRDR